MAERRMFSKRIVNSGRFLKMPISTQALYFHLGLNADDDGIVEAYNVLNSTGASEDDLRILVAKGFVYVLNEDLVTYIMDWTENNRIRADRKIDSVYKDLLLQIIPDVKLIQKRDRADRIKPPILGTSHGQPEDGIGKDRIGKDRIVEDSIKESISCQQIADLYNNTCVSFPRLKTLSDTRKKAIKARLRVYSLEDFKTLFTKAEASDFLKGSNDRNWSANFDWLIKDSNMAKVLDGNYDNKPKQTGKRKEPVPKWMNKEQREYDFDQIESELLANKPDLSQRAEELRERIKGGVT